MIHPDEIERVIATGRGPIRRENLSYPIVLYPNHYGAFIAFSRDTRSEPVLCACTVPSVQNYVRLRKEIDSTNSHRLNRAPFGSNDFPEIIAERSLRNETDPLSTVQFAHSVCHRCNLATPSHRYCDPMYGGRFKQQYGWYIAQNRLRCGLYGELAILGDVCPEEIAKLYYERAALVRECNRINERCRTDVDEWLRARKAARLAKQEYDPAVHGGAGMDQAERNGLLAKMDGLSKRAQRLDRQITNMIENETRQEFGVKKIGEGWIGESILLNIVRKIFADEDIIRHDRPEWLEGLELDVHVPSRMIAFEYQGQQHFHPIKAWGGQNALDRVRQRDERKAKICRELGVRLITVDYREPLTEEQLRKRIEKLRYLA